ACQLCAQPMPDGEEINYHGYSGPCPAVSSEASPAKLPIDRPCSACSAGDSKMEHHDHTPPFREASPVSTEVCNNCRKSFPCECSQYGDPSDATSAEQFWKRIDALEAALGSRKYQLDKAGETILRL